MHTCIVSSHVGIHGHTIKGKKAFKQISVFIILYHAEFAASAQDEVRLARQRVQVEIQHLLESLPSFFCNSIL